MSIRNIPDVTLKTRVRDESIGGSNPFRWQDLRIRDEFAGNKVVVFSLPGANGECSDADPYGETAPENLLAALTTEPEPVVA